MVLFLSSDWPISFSFSLRHSIKRRFNSQGKLIDDDTITRQFTWGGAMDDTDDMDDLIEMDWWKIKANQISAFNELCACCATETDPLSLEVVIKCCHFTWQIHSHERLKENLLYKAETFSSRMAIRSEIWAAEKCIIRPQILKMEVKRNVWQIVWRINIQILETEGRHLHQEEQSRECYSNETSDSRLVGHLSPIQTSEKRKTAIRRKHHWYCWTFKTKFSSCLLLHWGKFLKKLWSCVGGRV